MVKQNDLAGDSFGFSEIVRRHNDLDSARTDGNYEDATPDKQKA